MQDGEVGQDLEEDGQRVPDLHVVLGLEAHDEGLGDPVVPLVADVSVVLVVDVVVGLVLAVLVGGGHPELGHEPGIPDALLLEDVLRGVPPHDDLEHGGEEASVAVRLVLRAGGDGVRDVAEYAVEADQRREVGRLEEVDDLHKTFPIDSWELSPW